MNISKLRYWRSRKNDLEVDGVCSEGQPSDKLVEEEKAAAEVDQEIKSEESEETDQGPKGHEINETNPKNDLEEILLKLRALDREIIEELKELKESVEKHHHNCNIARTGGTALGAGGLAMTLTGLFLAVPTAGLSLGLSFGGLATSIAGGLTTSGTGITKQILMKKIESRMKESLAKRETMYEEYRVRMDEMREMVCELKMIGVSEEEAKKRILRKIAEGGDIFTVSLNVKKIVEGAIVANTVVSHGAMVGKAAATSVDLSTASTLAQGLGVGSQVGQAVLKGTTAFLGIAFVAIDTAMLIRDWNNAPELVKKLEDLVASLEEEVIRLEEELLEVQQYSINLADNPEGESTDSTAAQGLRIEDLLQDFDLKISDINITMNPTTMEVLE